MCFRSISEVAVKKVKYIVRTQMSNLEVDDEDEMSLLRGKRFSIRFIARQESEMPEMQGSF